MHTQQAAQSAYIVSSGSAMNTSCGGLISTGYGLQQTAQIAVPILEAQLNRLNAAAEGLEIHAARMHALADRLLGVNPESGEKSCAAPAPSCAVGKLNEAHERIALANARVNAALSRLEAL